MTFNFIQPNPIAPALGAEIGGIDLCHDLDDDVTAEIRRALLTYRVIFFRDQDITPDQHLAFAGRFGDLVDYPMVDGLDGYPGIVPVIKLAGWVDRLSQNATEPGRHWKRQENSSWR